ncbi:MFS transporter [Helcobacillus massiliensis]|uniref:MFS family permease n=1 Tax=Helcobacillus massiliensis TaxID=521392 RepID=A0A839R037_9MICO|nr:MFS transporter [Helcobacillus massiliensis]MBB3023581.1 MFS family permease [Helcobacillus massiliensis]MDK7742639.1 MFS transporter [Helcobacillus massiliensis]WOO92577.1 MFS transporter [Helcobacillus massiliensis]
MTATPVHQETFLDRVGIPRVLALGFLGVLIFMTGNGIETSFVSPHIAEAFGNRSHIELAAAIVTSYSLATLVGSYLAGVLADLWGPRRVMLLGTVIWVVFELGFLGSLHLASGALTFLTYFFRGFGFPLFAFAFLVWINAVVDKRRNGAAVGWFYVMFTGGMPTIGSLVAILMIPSFGGGYAGETWTMFASTFVVLAGFALAYWGVREPHGDMRLAPEGTGAAKVLFSGISLAFHDRPVFLSFWVRIINTAPQFGMLIILPNVIADQLGWGQSRWLLMTSIAFGSNVLFNAFFGWVGDRFGWVKTVRWFGVLGSAIGLLAWWYVPHMVEPGTTSGYVLSVLASCLFGIMLAGFVPLGAIMPAQAPEHTGAAMALYTTAAGGATFLGAAVVAVVLPFGGNVGVVWAFVLLYCASFVMTYFLGVDQEAAIARRDAEFAAEAEAEAAGEDPIAARQQLS